MGEETLLIIDNECCRSEYSDVYHSTQGIWGRDGVVEMVYAYRAVQSAAPVSSSLVTVKDINSILIGNVLAEPDEGFVASDRRTRQNTHHARHMRELRALFEAPGTKSVDLIRVLSAEAEQLKTAQDWCPAAS